MNGESLLHATSIVIDKKAVLLTGPSGVGKSDVALRLMMEHGAKLLSDDQTLLRAEEGVLFASAPATIAGQIEVRHLGLLKVPNEQEAPVVLLVELAAQEVELDRLPAPSSRSIQGVTLPVITLPGFAASTPAKIRAMLKFRPLA